jgi:DsbC/DsbD-like thiol-disulfide interchange protein
MIAAVVHTVQAQAPGGIAYAKVSAVAQPSSLKPGSRGAVLVTIDVEPGFHINSVKPADPYMIPTKLSIKPLAGFTVGSTIYPPNKTVKESYSPKPLLVYEGKAVIKVPIKAASGLKPGHYMFNGMLTYQGCNHTACFPPKTPAIHVPVTVM